MSTALPEDSCAVLVPTCGSPVGTGAAETDGGGSRTEPPRPGDQVTHPRDVPSGRGQRPVEEVAIARIVVLDDVQVRAAVDQALIQQYAEVLDDLPPIILYDTGQGVLELADGLHRMEGAKVSGRSTIRAEIRVGTHDDVLDCADTANARHGKPLTTVERHKAVRRLYTRHYHGGRGPHAQWDAGWSVERIGREMGYTAGSVKVIVAARGVDVKNLNVDTAPPPDPTPRRGPDRAAPVAATSAAPDAASGVAATLPHLAPPALRAVDRVVDLLVRRPALLGEVDAFVRSREAELAWGALKTLCALLEPVLAVDPAELVASACTEAHQQGLDALEWWGDYTRRMTAAWRQQEQSRMAQEEAP